jgi:hypothetical protein
VALVADVWKVGNGLANKPPPGDKNFWLGSRPSPLNLVKLTFPEFGQIEGELDLNIAARVEPQDIPFDTRVVVQEFYDVALDLVYHLRNRDDGLRKRTKVRVEVASADH